MRTYNALLIWLWSLFLDLKGRFIESEIIRRNIGCFILLLILQPLFGYSQFNEAELNDSRATANFVTNPLITTINGTQGQGDLEDWFKFSIHDVGDLKILWSGTPGEPQLMVLYNANNIQIVSNNSYVSSGGDSLVFDCIAPGTYYAGIKKHYLYTNSNFYTINIQLNNTLSSDPEYNDIVDSAKWINIISNPGISENLYTL